MAPKLRRGPILCDAGNGEHAALNPQVVTSGRMRGRVLCANCALRAVSDAIRKRQAFYSEPLAHMQARKRAARRDLLEEEAAVRLLHGRQGPPQELAEVVNLKGGRR